MRADRLHLPPLTCVYVCVHSRATLQLAFGNFTPQFRQTCTLFAVCYLYLLLIIAFVSFLHLIHFGDASMPEYIAEIVPMKPGIILIAA